MGNKDSSEDWPPCDCELLYINNWGSRRCLAIEHKCICELQDVIETGHCIATKHTRKTESSPLLSLLGRKQDGTYTGDIPERRRG